MDTAPGPDAAAVTTNGNTAVNDSLLEALLRAPVNNIGQRGRSDIPFCSQCDMPVLIYGRLVGARVCVVLSGML